MVDKDSSQKDGAATQEPTSRPLEMPVTPQMESPAEKPRDRIVVLGRRGAGKTVFLARLYDQLWNSAGSLHMRALSGRSHAGFMEVMEELRAGRWPASTLGASYTDIEISVGTAKRLLVALDYPGEVFHDAFVENADTEHAKELLDHVDRALAVILLIDPGVAHSGSIRETVDDDYGMVAAIHRIREWHDGGDIPVVIVFTKCDVHKSFLRDEGGLKAYAATHYRNLLRSLKRFKIFASVAASGQPSGNGSLIPDMTQSPIGVVEPVEYCLRKIEELEFAQEQRRSADRLAAEARRQAIESYKQQRRSVLFWSIFWSVAVVVLCAIAVISWMLVRGTE